ncbi:hypothetical protein BASA83_001218 [Batrachochytrium salamandrivorans]|nr:hypothetical protein BASA83_001218 [Batrachochytrium salamandrivorans]
MQFFTLFISAITVIASVHGAAIPIMDTPASPQAALETRSYNDPDSGSNLEKRSPGYGRSNFVPSTTAGPDLLCHLRLHRGAKYIHSPHPDRVLRPSNLSRDF